MARYNSASQMNMSSIYSIYISIVDKRIGRPGYIVALFAIFLRIQDITTQFQVVSTKLDLVCFICNRKPTVPVRTRLVSVLIGSLVLN